VEPILDETSLVPCPSRRPAARVLGLARTLKALDDLGAPRVLRSVRDAADRDIGDGNGLRRWCFDPATDRDARHLLAIRLTRPPFIDGDGGLFADAEGARAVEARVSGVSALGAGLAALTDGVIAQLASASRPAGGTLSVALTYLDEAGERSETIEVPAFASAEEVEPQRLILLKRIDRSVADGRALLARLGELFPRLRLGTRAVDQITALTGNEPVFRQLLRHLRALDVCATKWPEGQVFNPEGVTYSVESSATLAHGTYGPMRDFPVPDGFKAERWSLHTKLTGGAGARLYFRAVRTGAEAVVLVGYFGDHLPTVLNPT
jgi:hypothetical protein